MITTDAGRRLGTLQTEAYVQEEADGPATRPATFYRPRGVSLQNDGRWHYWMNPDHEEGYGIHHDGTGWRVTCTSWQPPGHVYRLGDGKGGLVDELPGADGPLSLTPGQTYTLRRDRRGAWTLHTA